jgi:hypothetical protein
LATADPLMIAGHVCTKKPSILDPNALKRMMEMPNIDCSGLKE